MGGSVGLGIVLSDSVVPRRFRTDFYLNVINTWLELNIQQWMFYVRVELKYGLDIGNNRWGGGWQTFFGFLPPITFGVARKW